MVEVGAVYCGKVRTTYLGVGRLLGNQKYIKKSQELRC